MRLLFSAGEASGDAYAAALIKELRRQAKAPVEVYAIGGQRVREAGAEIVVDASKWGSIGIIQAIRSVGNVFRGFIRAKRFLSQGKPGMFLAIDFGFFNVRLVRFAKQQGWKTVYFIPPGSWRKDRQGTDLPGICDAIITPFSWSAEMLRKMGANVHFFGHPLKQMIRMKNSDAMSAEVSDRIAVFPGSRQSEIELNLPILAQTLRAEEIAEFAVAPSWKADQLRKAWNAVAPNRSHDLFTEGDTYGVLKRARAGLVCSGTATLEAALCGCPIVVFYKLSKMTELEARLLRPKFDFISLPNILSGKRVVPELILGEATAANLRHELDALIDDSDARSAQLTAFRELDSALGPTDALTRSAELILILD